MGVTDENTVASHCPKQSAWGVPKQNGELMPFHIPCVCWVQSTSPGPDSWPAVTAESLPWRQHVPPPVATLLARHWHECKLEVNTWLAFC